MFLLSLIPSLFPKTGQHGERALQPGKGRTKSGGLFEKMALND